MTRIRRGITVRARVHRGEGPPRRAKRYGQRQREASEQAGQLALALDLEPRVEPKPTPEQIAVFQ